MLNWKNSLMILGVTSLAATPLAAQDAATMDEAKAAEDKSAETQAREQADPAIEEAVSALSETGKALKALEDGKNDEAAAALKMAIGKLEVLLTRSPELALAPVDVSTSLVDVSASPAVIVKARKEALRLMKDDQLQLARPIINNLASEVVVRTTSIPLAQYPLSLKSAAALIKDDKIEDAKLVLAQGLNTLVVDEVITPLPLLKAQVLIESAKDLSEKEGRSDEENQKLEEILGAIDLQIAKGEALQYGDKETLSQLGSEMKEIRKSTGQGGFGSGIFETLSGLFEGMGKDHNEAAGN